jgi:hypothetical protein
MPYAAKQLRSVAANAAATPANAFVLSNDVADEHQRPKLGQDDQTLILQNRHIAGSIMQSGQPAIPRGKSGRPLTDPR